MKNPHRPTPWWLLGLALSPLSAALAAELCPVEPWHCVRTTTGWQCTGQPQALQSQGGDPGARAAAATELKGDRLTGKDGERFVLEGQASAVRADQRMQADRIEYDVAGEAAQATGSVHFEDAAQAFYATEARANLADDSSELTDVRYALKAQRGQGRASKVTTEGSERTSLDSVTFTTCPGDDPAWQIEASKLVIDHAAGIATAEDFKLRAGGVPLLYWPHASFALDDRRKSGFLAPRIGVGSDGFDFAAPYYWNIAPAYDATLVPRLIADRGVQAGGEFRYLYRGGGGQIDGEWLPDDDLLDRDRDRYRVRHHGTLLGGVRLDADINHVSDDRYFADLGDSLNTTSTSVLGSSAQLSGGGRNWRWSVLADEYELILPDQDERTQLDPYSRLPRLHLLYDGRRGGWRYGGYAEWVDFRSDAYCVLAGDDCLEVPVTEGNRLDIAPYLGYAWEPSWGFLRTRATLRHTSYSLDRHHSGEIAPPGCIGDCLDESPSRTMPVFSSDAGLVFERSNAFGHSEWRQTLEPRLYYLYAPERDQANLPTFDTAALDFSFAQLFRENRYTGADRQADANQLTLALSSRLLDDEGGERAAFSLGQIYYFDPPEVFLPDESAAGIVDDRQRSAYVAEVRTRLSGTWSLTGGLRYDPETSATDYGAVRLQKHFGEDGLLNLGYRYRPGNIEQSDISALLPINDHWRAVLRWNYSLREHTTQEAVAGFEYVNCCYSVRLLSRNYLRGVGDERRNAIFLEFELRGIGTLGRDTGDFLRRAILGYQPFGGISE